MNNIIVDKSYNVELLVAQSSTSQQIYFPILQVLDNKVTQGIETYNILDVLKSVNNVALANIALLQVSYLNLVVGDIQQIWNFPLVSLINVRTGSTGAGSVFNGYCNELNNLKIIWAKSYVFISDVTKISAAQNEAFVFNVKYTDPVGDSSIRTGNG